MNAKSRTSWQERCFHRSQEVRAQELHEQTGTKALQWTLRNRSRHGSYIQINEGLRSLRKRGLEAGAQQVMSTPSESVGCCTSKYDTNTNTQNPLAFQQLPGFFLGWFDLWVQKLKTHSTTEKARSPQTAGFSIRLRAPTCSYW